MPDGILPIGLRWRGSLIRLAAHLAPLAGVTERGHLQASGLSHADGASHNTRESSQRTALSSPTTGECHVQNRPPGQAIIVMARVMKRLIRRARPHRQAQKHRRVLVHIAAAFTVIHPLLNQARMRATSQAGCGSGNGSG
jgi:hypothetical protein